MKKYLSVILGSIIIGIVYNLFFISNSIIPNGIYGIASIIHHITKTNPAIFILLFNILLLFISIFSQGLKKTKKYIIPSIVIPLTIFLSNKITNIVNISDLEQILIVITGSFAFGFGISIIYKEGANPGGIEILQDLLNTLKSYKDKNFIIFFEIIMTVLIILVVDLPTGIYHIISTGIIIYISTKSKIGISNSKSFYIITNKPKEIKNYLIDELKYDYTEFNIKGGFTKQKNKIIMTIIDTKDYYKIKEGIIEIDHSAFVSIIDNYESINKNITINKNNEKKSK